MPDTDNKHAGYSPEFAQMLAASEHSYEMAQLLAAVDDVERLEGQAGLADEHAAARRRLLEPFAAALLGICRTPGQRAATLKHLTAAVRVRQPSPAIMPGDETSRCEATLMRFHYNGMEIDNLKLRILKVNEPIVEILPRQIITDRRTIERSSLHAGRPVSFINVAQWDLQFPSDAEIDEVQQRYDADQAQMARQRAQNERSAVEAQIAQQQLAASRQRQIEAQEDAIAAIVERSRARRGVNS